MELHSVIENLIGNKAANVDVKLILIRDPYKD